MLLIMKIGNTSFNVEAVKKLSYKEFCKKFTHLGIDLDDSYFQLTGKRKPKSASND